MKNISCTMCGSSDVILEGNLYLCNTCGTKFAFDQAYASAPTSKMDELRDRIKRNQESSVDDSLSVDDLIREAKTALQSELSGSKFQAEKYCKRAFAKDSKNYDVLSTYSMVLLDTTTFDFDLLTKLKVILGNCPEEKKSSVLAVMSENTEQSLIAYIKKYPTSLDVIQKVNQFEKEYQKTVDPNLTSMRPRALEEVYHSVEKKWKIIQQAYKNAGDHPGKYEWETFVRDGLSNVELLESAVGELAFGNSSEVPVYELLSSMVSTIMNSCSWTTVLETKTDFVTGQKLYRDAWKKEYVLSDSLMQESKERLQKYVQKIKELSPNVSSSYGASSTTVMAEVVAKELLNNGYYNKKIEAIKILRERTGLGLAEAKDVIDRVFAEAGYGTYTSTKSGGGCYVATAVYGSYDCPQVWTLRRFRDYTLGESWYGRAFIRTYYAISPTLVKWFGHTEWFKKMWKGRLDRMVANLNADGVEDTPYVDQEW